MENEEEIKLQKDLKKLLVSEINLIRDTFSVISIFLEGMVQTSIQVLKDVTGENNSSK